MTKTLKNSKIFNIKAEIRDGVFGLRYKDKKLPTVFALLFSINTLVLPCVIAKAEALESTVSVTGSDAGSHIAAAFFDTAETTGLNGNNAGFVYHESQAYPYALTARYFMPFQASKDLKLKTFSNNAVPLNAASVIHAKVERMFEDTVCSKERNDNFLLPNVRDGPV